GRPTTRRRASRPAETDSAAGSSGTSGALGRQLQVDQVGIADVVDARDAGRQVHRVLGALVGEQGAAEVLGQIDPLLVRGSRVMGGRDDESRRQPAHLRYVWAQSRFGRPVVADGLKRSSWIT